MIGFDTLHATDTLTAAGVPAEQARAIVAMVGSALGGHVATRTDVADMRAAMKADFADAQATVNADIADMRATMKTDFADAQATVNADIAEVRAQLKSEITNVRAEIATAVSTLTWRMVAVQTAMVAAFAGLLRLMQAS